MSLVEARGLGRTFTLKEPFRKPVVISAVNGVDLSIARGETLAIVGESGCGKSTLGRLLLGLLPASSGSIRFEGTDLASLPPAGLRALRARMQIVFQNTLAALDPRMPVGEQIGEPLAIHGDAQQAVRRAEAERLVRDVGLDPILMTRRPHELSGGQRQRVVIARALATRPSFVVFDEPVSALDVSVQAQIIALIRKLQASAGFASAFISHDLRVVRHVADRVAVMYLGRIVEEGPVAEVFRNPAHPYTKALIGAVPQVRATVKAVRQRLAGEPANPAQMPGGCAFHPRCPVAQPRCSNAIPQLQPLGEGRIAACHLLAGAPAVRQSA